MPHAATVERTVRATPSRVWTAIASTVLEDWYWPVSFDARVTVDPQVGGGITVRSGPMGMGFTGTYTLVEPDRRLAHTWRWDGETLETLVRIELVPAGSATTITVRHEGFPDRATADEHAQGWGDCLDRLPAHLARTSP
jgi:uncharacterized protein YndB with AHSA1/START domain